MKNTFRTTALAGLVLCASQAMAQAPGQPSAVIQVDCDYDCLIGYVNNYIDALGDRDFSRAKLADGVVFSENNVLMPVGNDGLWGTISGVRDGAMTIADDQTGNAAWFGLVEEHGNPAYLAVRIQVEDGLITEIESVVNRLPDMPKPFGNPDTVSHDPVWNDILPEEGDFCIGVATLEFETLLLEFHHPKEFPAIEPGSMLGANVDFHPPRRIIATLGTCS